MIFMYLVFGISALIGLWALTCPVSVLVKSGGPVQLFKKWLQAVKGGR